MWKETGQSAPAILCCFSTYKTSADCVDLLSFAPAESPTWQNKTKERNKQSQKDINIKAFLYTSSFFRRLLHQKQVIK